MSTVSRGSFVTLTYPSDYPVDARTHKRHLRTWWKRLRRKQPSASAVWKLEFQARGAPHYHLLVVGVSRLGTSWLSRSWYEVVGSTDSRHLAAGTQVQWVRRTRDVIGYAAKYLGKVDSTESTTHQGRFWGVFGRDAEPYHVEEARITLQQHHQLRRTFRRYVEHRARGRRGFRFRASWLIVSGCVAQRLVDFVTSR